MTVYGFIGIWRVVPIQAHRILAGPRLRATTIETDTHRFGGVSVKVYTSLPCAVGAQFAVHLCSLPGDEQGRACPCAQRRDSA